MVLDAGRMLLSDLEQFSERKNYDFLNENWNFQLKIITLVEYTFSMQVIDERVCSRQEPQPVSSRVINDY